MVVEEDRVVTDASALALLAWQERQPKPRWQPRRDGRRRPERCRLSRGGVSSSIVRRQQ